jgi:hypothetical protein
LGGHRCVALRVGKVVSVVNVERYEQFGGIQRIWLIF